LPWAEGTGHSRRHGPFHREQLPFARPAALADVLSRAVAVIDSPARGLHFPL
jgi:hypothetical protein